MQVPGRCVHVDCILESNHWNVGYLVVPYMNCTTSTEYSITYYMYGHYLVLYVYPGTSTQVLCILGTFM